MNEQSPLERQLGNLRDQLAKSQKMDSLYRCEHCGKPSEGFHFLRSEINKALEASKDAGVSVKSLESPVTHATFVGSYNSLKTLLATLDAVHERGPRLSEQIQTLESENKEELERLGNQQ